MTSLNCIYRNRNIGSDKLVPSQSLRKPKKNFPYAKP